MKEIVPVDRVNNSPLKFLPKPLRLAAVGLNTGLALAFAACGPGVGNIGEQSSAGNPNSPAITKSLDDLNLAFSLRGPARFTGGPHDSNRKGGVRNSIDIAPKVKADCPPGVKKFLDDPLVVASASGTVTAIGNERDPSDKMHSILRISTPKGINVETMHLGQFQVSVGDRVKAGETVVGKLACETPPGGDISQGMHAHTSLWTKDGTPIPIKDHIFSGWTVHDRNQEYNGTLTKPGEETRTADTRTCGPDQTSIKACGGTRNDLSIDTQALIANPREGATPISTIPAIAPTFVPLIPQATSTPTEVPKMKVTSPEIPSGFKLYPSTILPYRVAIPTNFQVITNRQTGTAGLGFENFMVNNSKFNPNASVITIYAESLQPRPRAVTLDAYKDEVVSRLQQQTTGHAPLYVQSKFMARGISNKDAWLIDGYEPGNFAPFYSVLVLVDQGTAWEIASKINYSDPAETRLFPDVYQKMINSFQLDNK